MPEQPSRLWRRRLRSRVVINLLLAALSTFAVTTAVLGPLLVRAIEQSTVVDTFARAGPSGTSIVVSALAEAGADLGP